MKNSSLKGLLAAALVLVSSSAFAQQSDDAIISAKATVVNPIVVEFGQDLVFGNVTPGNEKTVSSTGVSSKPTGGEQAGGFIITKGGNTEVQVLFALPTQLITGTIAEPGNTMPIAFEATDARFSNSDSPAANGADHLVFNPNSLITLVNAEATAPYFTSSAFYVYLGGKVTPVDDQVAGEYKADVKLTLTYN
jgi:hypothetical protein